MKTTLEDQVARYSRAVTATMERQEAVGSPRELGPYAPSGPLPRHGRSIWAVAALFLALVALAAGAAVIGGGTTSTDLAGPSGESEQAAIATDLLDDAVAAVSGDQADSLCAEQSADVSVCEEILAELDPAQLPTTAPQVLGSRSSQAGFVITVCGIDGLGEPYVTDLESVGIGNDAHAFVSPIYWSGVRITTAADNGDGTAGAEVDSGSTAESDAIPAGCPTA